jgi:hypothetical protein
MGCCSSPKNSGEDYIVSLIQEMYLHKTEYQALEKLLQGNSEKSKISKHVFYRNIVDHLYNTDPDENKNFIFHDKIIDDIILFDVQEKCNIYHILLPLYSMLRHNNVVQEFYQLILMISYSNVSEDKFKDKTLKINYKQFKSVLKTYLEINIIGISTTICNVLIVSRENEFEKFDIEILIKKVYKEDNLKKYLKHLIERFESENEDLQNKTYLSITDLGEFFREREFIFNFKKLRKDFINFYLKMINL